MRHQFGDGSSESERAPESLWRGSSPATGRHGQSGEAATPTEHELHWLGHHARKPRPECACRAFVD
eukprot:8731007-Alexandrium_andersonii.AAC.1